MTDETKIVVEQNPYDGTWDVGWESDDGQFTPQFCGYTTKEEAEAEIPGFDERVEREFKAWCEEKDAEEQEENKRWPNVRRVRARIKKLSDSGKPENLLRAFDASDKLAVLMDMDRHEHITWPLPSWEAIESGRAYRR